MEIFSLGQLGIQVKQSEKDRLAVFVDGFLAEGGVIWVLPKPADPMITRNDYDLRLFNGGVGITLPDPETRAGLRVFSAGPEGMLLKFQPLRLREHETVCMKARDPNLIGYYP